MSGAHASRALLGVILKTQQTIRIAVLLAGVAFAQSAYATTVLSDNFDSEAGGATVLQDTGFTNFNVTGTGVDLVGPGNAFGITCASGSCVDLDGTPGPGGLITKDSYAFSAGDTVTLSFEIAGNQRSNNANEFDAGFALNGLTTVKDLSTGGAFGNSSDPAVTSIVDLKIATFTTRENQPFETYTMSFVALQSGTVQAFIETQGTGNVGPLLDNVNLSIGGVPEPSTWAMFLMGFGALGFMMRGLRRNGAIASA